MGVSPQHVNHKRLLLQNVSPSPKSEHRPRKVSRNRENDVKSKLSAQAKN